MFSFWNFKIKGLIGAFLLFLLRFIELIKTKIISFFVKNNLASCGKNVTIESGFNYRNPSMIKIGSNVQIGKNVTFTSELKEGYIVIEDNVIIGRNSKIDFSGGILIKENTLLSEGVMIQTHTHGLDPRSKPEGKKLTINKNVWVGLNSIILFNSLEIGENSVIAAGSLVTKKIISNSVYAGIPAKQKRTIV